MLRAAKLLTVWLLNGKNPTYRNTDQFRSLIICSSIFVPSRELPLASSPGVGNCGGIFELIQIAAMAETYNVRVSPHNCASSLCTAASLQVLAASAAPMPLETYPYFSEQNDYVQVLKNPPEQSVVNGKMEIPTSPGMGAEVDLKAIEPFRCFDYSKDAA